MSDLAAAVALALVTAILGAGSYLLQKRIERQVELSKRQRAAYERYMQSYYDWTFTEGGTSEGEEAENKYRNAYFTLFTLASDRFLHAAFAFHSFAWEEPYPNFKEKEDIENFERLWTKLILALRKDAEIKSQSTEKDIKEHLPWYWNAYKSPASIYRS